MNEKFGFAPFGLVIIFRPTLGGIWMQTQFMVCQACHKNRYQIQLFPGKKGASPQPPNYTICCDTTCFYPRGFLLKYLKDNSVLLGACRKKDNLSISGHLGNPLGSKFVTLSPALSETFTAAPGQMQPRQGLVLQMSRPSLENNLTLYARPFLLANALTF